MIAAFAVFGFMVNNGILDFDFTGVEISLEIRHVIQGVPQAKFRQRKEIKSLCLAIDVFLRVSLLHLSLMFIGTKQSISAEIPFFSPEIVV